MESESVSASHRLPACALAALVAGLLSGCSPEEPEPIGKIAIAQAKEQTSASCIACHQDIGGAWSRTDHALANRPIDAARDREAFTLERLISGGGESFELAWPEHGQPTMTEMRAGSDTIVHKPDLILGAKPLWQPLVPDESGRWQPSPLAFDPAKEEWFNVFGQENRQPGEWGHWRGRGMNWNSMCAQCHMTGFEKNYSAASDAYASTWVEHGVGCIQCHGPMPAGHDKLMPGGAAKLTSSPSGPFRGDRARMMQTCAPCHARNEPLTGDFQPGDSYDDHYRVTLPVDPAVFHPDGQQRDEVFNWTSVLLSRMGHAGVTCTDCHDPHTNKTVLPVANNQLCLQCHAEPGRVQPNGTRATPINPTAHSRHAADSPGNNCVACHMPTTTYMQRAARHDHGWLKPDPLLTKELGIPNACSRCHEDKGLDWNIAKADEWFGEKLDSRQRARARAVAAAQADRPGSAAGLLALLRDEDIPAWRATYLSLLSQTRDGATGRVAAHAALKASDPLERAAAVRYFAGTSDTENLLSPLLQDPVRLVRLDAAWALSPHLPVGSPARQELDAYLALALDQPSGRVRLGQDLANRGQLAEAEAEMKKAAGWDRFSPGIQEALGFVLHGQNRTAEAAGTFSRAADLAPQDAFAAYRAALVFAEVGQLREAETSLRESVRRDPQFARGWYNLGLLLAQTNRLADSIDSLQRAESLSPSEAGYPYALATVLLRTGDKASARAAAKRVLQIDPKDGAAQQFLQDTR